MEDESSKTTTPDPLVRRKKADETQEAAVTSEKSLEATSEPSEPEWEKEKMCKYFTYLWNLREIHSLEFYESTCLLQTHKIYVTSQLTLRDTCQPSMSALLQECPPPVKGTSLSQRVKFGTPLNHVHPDVPRFWILKMMS
ncbi:hypothetical protein JHK84_055218 [Glycine max]|nr:hypothetical protein JHK84_055218 [Glycine max]